MSGLRNKSKNQGKLSILPMMAGANQTIVDSFYTATGSLLALKTAASGSINALEKEEDFKTLLSAPTWPSSHAATLKVMAAQYIPEYILYFGNLHEMAINAQLDLCEDDNIKVRKESIKNLPAFSKNAPHYATRIADVLIQLLQADDPVELAIVSQALLLSFQTFPKDSTEALFIQIEKGSDLIRQQTLTFLEKYLMSAISVSMKQKLLLKFLTLIPHKSFSESELELIVTLSSQCISTIHISSHSQLDILYKQRLEALLLLPNNVTLAKINLLYQCYKPLFIAGTSSFRFIYFLITQILMRPEVFTGGSLDKLSILKIVCDCFCYVSDLSSLSDLIQSFGALLEDLMVPLSVDSPDAHKKPECLLLEPILYFMLFYRIKVPNSNKENSPALLDSLKKLLILVQKNFAIYSKDLEGISKNDAKSEKKVRFYYAAKSSIDLIKELLKGKNHSFRVNLITSWNFPPPPVSIDKKMEQMTVSKAQVANNSQVQVSKKLGNKMITPPSAPAFAVVKKNFTKSKVGKKTFVAKERQLEQKVEKMVEKKKVEKMVEKKKVFTTSKKGQSPLLSDTQLEPVKLRQRITEPVVKGLRPTLDRTFLAKPEAKLPKSAETTYFSVPIPKKELTGKVSKKTAAPARRVTIAK